MCGARGRRIPTARAARTREVGGAVARALVDSDVCSRLTLLGRSAVASLQGETKVEQVNDYSRQHQHPLLCTMEEA